MSINRFFLRDGVFLVLAYALTSQLVVTLFGGNSVMGFQWLLLGPAVYLAMRHGLGVSLLAFAGVVLGRLLQAGTPVEIAATAGRHALVVLLGAWTFRMTGGVTMTFNCVPDYLRLFGIGGLMGLMTGGVNLILRPFGLEEPNLGGTLHQVAGVMFGFVMTMLPLLVVHEWPHAVKTRRGIWEGFIIVGLAILCGQVVFLNWAHDTLGQVARGYWMFLFVTLAALRLGPSGTMIVISITCIQALASALYGVGFFADDIARTQLSNYYFYMLSVSSDGALVAVLFMKGQQDQQALATRSAELEHFNTELQRTNADLEQFAYVASHDLREPLRMVSSYMGLLERRYGSGFDSNAREYIAFAKEGAQRMDQLVQELLDFSRIGRIATPPECHPVADLVDEAIQNLKFVIEEAGAEIKISSDLPELVCRREEIARVFQNLVGNAVKFRIPERHVVIDISCQCLAGAWRFAVADNGIGLDPSYAERIFMIFQRLHTRDKYEGTGIGLAVCKKVIEQHGGHIWVESTPGQGSTFFFTLPDAPPHPEGTPESQAIP